MIVKVCGMKYQDNIMEVDKLKVDIIGFIFHEKSPRFISKKPDCLPVNAKRAGIFVDTDINDIIEKAQLFSLDIIQLHGNESPETCRILKNKGFEVIKAFHAEKENIKTLTYRYEGLCKYFLFDTPCKEMGGSGKRFDWSLLQNYSGSTPFLLSGGISLNDIPDIKKFRHNMMAGVDINSGFEISPGIKNVYEISNFINCLKL